MGDLSGPLFYPSLHQRMPQGSTTLVGAKLPIRRPFEIAAISISLCGASWLAAGMYLYWNNLKLVNFLAAWIPFAITVLIAFVPESHMAPVKKVLWRTAVISIGVLASIIWWHQQVILEIADTRNQQQIASGANEKFEKVENDLDRAKTDLARQIENVPTEITRTVTKTESDLTASIGKVGILPAKYAQLQFGVFDSGMAAKNTVQALIPDPDGIYSLDFTVTNISDTAATGIDVWVYICDQCSFAETPIGFDKPQGMKETERHSSIMMLNPGVAFEKMTIKFKIAGGPFTYTDIFLDYSCSSCGKKGPPQSIRGFLAKPLPRPNLPSN